jgi:hypothetical protein
LTANEIARQCRQSIGLALRPAEFDRYIPAFNVAGFVQALPETGYKMFEWFGGGDVEKSDHRDRRLLLRARRERPRCRRAAEQRDELAAFCMTGKEHCES